MTMTHFRLRLTPAELNQVIAALGRQPHDDVAALIAHIHAQAGEQIRAHQQRAERSAEPPACP